ncbi:MAG: glycosyltransferase family 39 protein [candidate division Zixibacteria bacterium]|nr:glycosyltransferase family 39 protein [candidate division Zixibacteria bacterium]MDD5424999.1 glycosyltransferase family 39 protein [candidate division Zixibacteria bacterium]
MKNIIRIIAGVILTAVGLLALLGFSLIKEKAYFLSPDGVIDPHSFLQFKICLSSLLIIGIYLIFYRRVNLGLALTTRRITDMSRVRFLLLFLIAGFLLRLAVQIFLPLRFWADCLGYEELALNWLKMGGYYDGSFPTANWPPGYPFFLSRLYWLFGHQPQVGVFANILLNLGICYLAYLIIRKIWLEKVARLTLVIMLLFPSQILFVNLLLSENLFTFLFILSLYLFIRGRSISEAGLPRSHRFTIFMGGLTLGLATLTRALTLVYLPLLIPFWKWQSGYHRTAFRNFLIALVGLSLVVVPWMVRNHYKLGAASIATNGGVNLYLGNNPIAGMGWIPPDSNIFVLNNPAYEAYNDSLGFTLGKKYILDHPLSFIKRGLMKVAYFYSIDVDAVHYDLIQAAGENKTNGYVILGFMAQYYYILILFMAAGGFLLVLARPSRYLNAGAYLLVATILYWSGVHFVFFGFGRFHFPIMAMISALAALFIAYKTEKMI